MCVHKTLHLIISECTISKMSGFVSKATLFRQILAQKVPKKAISQWGNLAKFFFEYSRICCLSFPPKIGLLSKMVRPHFMSIFTVLQLE